MTTAGPQDGEHSGQGARGAQLAQVVQTVAHLRGEQGCPWNREQTHLSLRRYLFEEAAEAAQALEGSDAQLRDELGDVLYQVIFHAQIAAEEGRFDMDDVIAGLEAKLRRRHPHVFDPDTPAVATAQEVVPIWQAAKAAERLAEGGPGAEDGRRPVSR